MKIQPIMNDQFVTYSSELTTEGPDHVKLNTNYISEGKVIKSNSSSATGARGNVRFSSITIQEYSIEPGMNPGGSKGCPLTIGWDPISTKSMDLDVFESQRCENRRDNEHLKLVSAQREEMLLNMGYTMKAVLAGTKAANRTRRDRLNTLARLNSINSEEMIEGLRKNALNLVSFGNKKRQEQKFLAPYNTESNKDGRVLKAMKSISPLRA